ncbi:MAG: DUF3047 domain-containing protein [Nitrospira sp.]|jgi:hypothetical protein|nr:DUF3047 domain-containing protein [Nitrospira sp.]
MVRLGFALLTALLAAPAFTLAQGLTKLEVGNFSAAAAGVTLPDGWTPLTFKKIERHTTYEVVKDGSISVVKAVSEASASGLTKAVTIDPHEYPIVRWRWKVENVLPQGNVHRKDGDDYPARLYITFAYEPDKVGLGRKLKYQAGRMLFGDIPIGALNYIWDAKSPVGTVVDNAFTDFAKMIVVESGSQRIGSWVEEERNVFEDYRLAFGEEPPAISGVAIMSDTDNTKERAVAYYGDIVFVKALK